jgi:MFS transporter, BCD family, chlorophyll transporter
MRTHGSMLFPRSRLPGFGWLSIIRLGLVQAALGSVVVLTTSTLNRVMVVELAMAAAVPGFLVGLHYAVQMLRPLFGHGSDVSGKGRSLWILGGMALLALAGTAAAMTIPVMEENPVAGVALASLAYLFIGVGIGASGTSILALLASRTAPQRRPAAATIVWIMMIAGIVIAASTTGRLLDPYSHERLIVITAATGAMAVLVTALALSGLERIEAVHSGGAQHAAPGRFRDRLTRTWADREARLFTIFVFLSMLAYATQDLILEPFGGLLFAMTPGQSTQLSGTQHGGVLLGMILVGVIGSSRLGLRAGLHKGFTLAGCLGSAMALAGLAAAARFAPDWPLQANVFALGFFNGMFTISAIGAMMTLAGAERAKGGEASEGIRMGVWGAAQAIAFGLGGFLGTVSVDAVRALTGSVPQSFAAVFTVEAAMFVASALIALRIAMPARTASTALETSRHSSLEPAE